MCRQTTRQASTSARFPALIIGWSLLITLAPVGLNSPCPALRAHVAVAASPDAAGPDLPPWQRMLTGEDSTRVEELEQQIHELREQAEYAEAIPMAEEVQEIRQRAQGADHWQAADAGRLVETLGRIAALPPESQAELAAADSATRPVAERLAVGQYAEAAGICQMQLQVRLRCLGGKHPDVATSLSNMGELLHLCGQFAAAERSHREALTIRREVLGNDHPGVATNLSDLAVALKAEGDYAGAEALYREALELQRRVLGSEHQDVATTLGNMSVLFQAAGNYAKAESLQTVALAMRRKLFGDLHPEVAASLNNLAAIHQSQGDNAGAARLYRETLEVLRSAVGDEHPYVATTLSNLAMVVQALGDYTRAETLHRDALALRQKLLGPDHPEVAYSLNNLSALLLAAGEYPEAEAVFRRAINALRGVLGEEHPVVATALCNLGVLLEATGDYVDAEPLQRRALAIQRRVLGDQHPDVARTLNTLAALMHGRGDHGEAEPLCREALTIQRKAYGGDHQEVATTLNNLALILKDEGDYSGAESLEREALDMWKRLFGDEHPDVARSMNNLGLVLRDKGDYIGAEPLLREALATWRRLLGRDHPDVPVALSNLAVTAGLKGDYSEAQSLLCEAVEIWRGGPRRDHPDAAAGLFNLAGILHSRGHYAAAESVWSEAAEAFEEARLRMSTSGMGRAAYAAAQSPLASMAGCLARNGKYSPAWEKLEAGMARGLLDAMSVRHSRPISVVEREREESLIGRLGQVDERISALLAVQDSTGKSRARADTLRWEREALQAELAEFEADMAAEYGVAAGQVYDIAKVQEHLTHGSAFLAWVNMEGHPHAVDANGEHWACVVRHEGEPVWVRLPGSGEGGGWTEDDDELPGLVREALGRPPTGWEEDEETELIKRLHAQRVAPVEPHLEGVAHLIVLPAGWMAGVPVEVLVDAYTVSYAPSATMYAWLQERAGEPAREGVEPWSGEASRRPPWSGEAQRSPLLALGDPVFEQPEEPEAELPEPPEEGVLLSMVVSGSNAERSGLREGDVLLSYRGEMLAGADELGPAIEEAAAGEDSMVPVTLWREGETVELSVAPGRLGVRPSEQPVPEAVALRRRLDRVLETTRGRAFVPLPWTRTEVEGIAELFGREERGTTILLGPDASERRLDELARSGELGSYRYIHLATHAVMDDEVAMRSALILSQDPVDDSFERALEGLEVFDGRLTAEQIVRTWKIDAELVTLSACETALGKESGGEGFLGFSQALFVAGARSLVLTLWKVQDTPAMLLMRRFYENLLGRFDEPRVVAGSTYEPGSGMPKGEALREAKEWLRGLTWEELREVEEELSGGWRGEQLPMEMPPGLMDRDCPYEDPHYWGAFILMGNPD